MNRQLEKSSKPLAVFKNPCPKSTMEKLYEKRSTTGDIKFMVDGEVIHAHRCVLAAHSPRYEAQFYGSMAESDTINVIDVSAAAFKEFLQFFYTDEVTITLNNIEDVLNLAKQSLVGELVTECTNFVINVIGLDKLLWCYRLAIDYDLKPLEEFCVKHIGVNIKSLFQSADFLSCERDELCHVLNLDAMDCKETDVIDACISWARAKCQRNGMDATDTKNLRMALGGALFKIRFCSMTTEEFATINQKYFGLLSPQESIEVFHTITLKANAVRSNTFGDDNGKAREPLKLSLEYALAKGSRIPFNSDTAYSYIYFRTDKAIVLNGFVICDKINDQIKVELTYKSEWISPKHTTTTSEHDMKVTFDSPIRIEADEQCSIYITSKTFKQSFASLCGLDSKNETTQNGVSFTITCHPKSILITRLLFSVGDTV